VDIEGGGGEPSRRRWEWKCIKLGELLVGGG
jgi:hypothetical protein